jgi:hypothetical protein
MPGFDALKLSGYFDEVLLGYIEDAVAFRQALQHQITKLKWPIDYRCGIYINDQGRVVRSSRVRNRPSNELTRLTWPQQTSSSSSSSSSLSSSPGTSQQPPPIIIRDLSDTSVSRVVVGTQNRFGAFAFCPQKVD